MRSALEIKKKRHISPNVPHATADQICLNSLCDLFTLHFPCFAFVSSLPIFSLFFSLLCKNELLTDHKKQHKAQICAEMYKSCVKCRGRRLNHPYPNVISHLGDGLRDVVKSVDLVVMKDDPPPLLFCQLLLFLLLTLQNESRT